MINELIYLKDMKKSLLAILIVVIIILLGIIGWLTLGSNKNSSPAPTAATTDSRNTAYTINNQIITLKNGQAIEPISGSSAQVITKIFSVTPTADLDEDGNKDEVAILTQTAGGSGTFYYTAVALHTASGVQGTNAILLGDRIAPQNSSLNHGIIVVNYADRKPDEAMTAAPSVGVSKYLVVENKILREIIYQNDKIRIEAPAVGADITSPLTVRGQARGTWYFEASFPVNLTDWDGKIIAAVPAQAQDDWMTTEFVPFTATLIFDKPSYGQRGTLIFRKDNPSGLPEYEDALEIPVFFK